MRSERRYPIGFTQYEMSVLLEVLDRAEVDPRFPGDGGPRQALDRCLDMIHSTLGYAENESKP